MFLICVYPTDFPKTCQQTQRILCLTAVPLIYFCCPSYYVFYASCEYIVSVSSRVQNSYGKVICFSTQVRYPLRKGLVSVVSSLKYFFCEAVFFGYLLQSCVCLYFWIICLISWPSKASFRVGMLSVFYLPLSFTCKILITTGRYVD